MQPDLIARIEAASEARELFLIAFHSAFPDIDDEASQQWFSLMDKLLRRIRAQDYLDAALMLVPEGWTVATISQNDDKSWFAELREGFLTSYNRVALSPVKSSTPALCIAALRAQQKECNNG